MNRILPTGFKYEFRRTISRLPILLIILVGILVALAAATQVATNPPGFARMYSGALFYSGGAYHFDFYAFNEYGSPLPGIGYLVQVSPPSGSPILTTLYGNTSTNGMLELSAFLPEGPYLASVAAGPQNGLPYWTQGESNGAVSFGSLPPGKLVPLLSPIAAAVDRSTGFSGEPALQVFFPNPNATSGPGCPVYYALENLANGSPPGPLPESSMTLLGDLNSPLQTFPLSISPTNNSRSLNVQVEIFSPSGSLLALDTNSSAASFSPYQTPTSVSDAAFSYFASEMVLLLPLMAIVSSFSVYARDRISGVLESVLVRPVTREGVATSRFLAVLTALLFALGVGMVISDELIHVIVGYFVFPSYLLSVYLGFAIVTIFFVGMVFLLSHLLRSMASLLAAASGLFLFFGLFWNSVLSSLGALFGGLPGTPAGARLQLELSFFNPLEYPVLVLAGITNTTPLGVTSYGGSPATYGITPVALVVSALAWTLIPLFLFMWRIRTRD